mmetsp:Transcript_82942/g.231347  ORF Transcript_82942/g.231347 Transcript_82942/m.231347 type:complete len:750 (-) Transcript_82942:101-2350(-)
MNGAFREAARLTEGAAQLTDRAVNKLAEKLNASAKSAKVSYANGDHYEGQTLDPVQAVRHGYGVYQYDGGRGRYEGEFLDDDKHGAGTLFCEGGDVYDGQWCRDLQHGRGTFVHWSPTNGIWTYAGDFHDGQREGFGALVARDQGALVGTWAAGSLVSGCEMSMLGAEGLQVAVLGVPSCREIRQDAAQDDQESNSVQKACQAGLAAPSRTPLGRAPKKWSVDEVVLWLRGLGIEAPDQQSYPGATSSTAVPQGGARLLAVESFEDLVQGQSSQDSQVWRSMLATGHAALRQMARDAEMPVRSWAELQAALPMVARRLIPRGEIVAAGGHGQVAEWRGMTLELLPLPVRLPATSAGAASSAFDSDQASPDADAASDEDVRWLPLALARGFVQDLEALAAVRHPNIRTLLGVTLGPLQGDMADEDGAFVVPTLVYEGARGSCLLFEWIHASLPDGSRRPMDFRLEMRICIGVCEGLASLASRGLVFGALCSVNVELVQAARNDILVRLAHAGGSWWRWGWQRSLHVRDAGQPRRRALGVDEVVKRYAVCPVNWFAPEVLRGEPPQEPADVYGLGLVLWEMLYRTIPFGDFSIAQIVGAVGYGRRSVRAAASPGASTETNLLHEVVGRCTQREPHRRPRVTTLLASLQDAAKAYERRRLQRSALEKLSDKTEAFASGLLSGNLQRSLYGGSAVRKAVPPPASAIAGEDGPRMVRLDTGHWVVVDSDLVEQFPGDEEKWRALMAFRAHYVDV